MVANRKGTRRMRMIHDDSVRLLLIEKWQLCVDGDFAWWRHPVTDKPYPTIEALDEIRKSTAPAKRVRKIKSVSSVQSVVEPSAEPETR